MDDLQKRKQEIEEQIRALQAEQAALERKQAPRKPRKKQAETTQGLDLARLSQLAAGRGLTVNGNVTSSNIIVGDHNRIEYKLTLEEAGSVFLLGYYRALAKECSRLPLNVISDNLGTISPQGEQEITLPEVYTDLNVTAAPDAKKQDTRDWVFRLERGEGGGQKALLEAINEENSKKIALLGVAGSGKTSFVNYLTYRLAENLTEGAVRDIPAELVGRLPVRIILRRAARYIPVDSACGQAEMLWQALQADIGRLIGGDNVAEIALMELRRRMISAGGLILLDGLDEAPEAHRRRACLLEAISAFLGGLHNDTRVILTARPYAYAASEWRQPGYQELILSPLNREQIERFLRRWYSALEQLRGWEAGAGKTQADDLAKVLQERAYLADLASRPLLLTLTASLHATKTRLPEGRADLYEEAVRLLLVNWQRAGKKEVDGVEVDEEGISRVLKLDESRIREALERLAFEIHTRQRGEKESRDLPADILRKDLRDVFTDYLPDDISPQVLIDFLERRSGLLISRDEGIYAFPHRSFQEFLAACHLLREDDYEEQLVDLAREDSSWWREVLLMAIGRLKSGVRPNDAVKAIEFFILRDPDAGQDLDDTSWRAIVLAGMAGAEIRLPEMAETSRRPAGESRAEAALARLRCWLTRLVEEGRLPAGERAEAGDTLGRLGDPRFAPRLFGLPVLFRGKPEECLGFVRIPAGPFRMGSRKGEQGAYDNEYGNPDTLEIPYDYWVARYPVTVGQYAHFVQEQDYEDPQWWGRSGWDWRTGKYDSQVESQSLKNWLARRKPEQRGEPFGWQSQIATPNRPVVGVSWFEAAAYAKWLNNKLLAASGPFGMLGDRLLARAENLDAKRLWRDFADQKLIIRLPTEAEWEKAARGADGRKYPWGMEAWDEERANIDDSHISHPSPVGMYPQGARDGQIFDQSGNVWEWTLSDDRPYPYVPHAQRKEVPESARRVLRGGSWNSYGRDARCASRGRPDPDAFFDDIGLRLILSPGFSDSGF